MAAGLVGTALVVPATGAHAAAVPEGPRLAVVKLARKPAGSGIVTLGLEGGERQRVFAASQQRGRRLDPLSGPAWSPDGSLLAFSHSRPRRISVVPAGGGRPRVVPGTRGGFLPVFSPDGRSLAFSRTRRKGGRRYRWGMSWRYESTSVWIVDLETGARRRLTRWRDDLDHFASSFSPDGSTLLVTRVDVERSQDPEIVALYFDDRTSRLLVGEGAFPVYSPDGSKIALFRVYKHWYRLKKLPRGHLPPELGGTRWRVRENIELYVVEADGSNLRRLTRTPHKDELFASWDPSGERIAYAQFRRGRYAAPGTLMQINSDGTCPTRITSAPQAAFFGPAWRPGPGREAGPIVC